MTIPVSTVPQVRAYLFQQLTTAVPNTAEVFDGEDTQSDREDWVKVLGARRQVGPLAMVGGGGQFWRDEKYSVEIEIETFTAGRVGSMEASETRAYALLAVLETVVRQDPSLGGLVLQANPKDSTDVPSWSPDGSGAIVTINTSVEVYTTL